MTHMTLYRAVAYRLQRANTPSNESWPEVTVFLEADSRLYAQAKLQTLLARAWDCATQEIEHYNLFTEAELRAGLGNAVDIGDAALLCNGWSHGPLFARADRTLMLVTPPTLVRLQAARRLAQALHLEQRMREQAVSEIARAEAAARVLRQRERAEGAHATGFGTL
jgi:hypothetical protein